MDVLEEAYQKLVAHNLAAAAESILLTVAPFKPETIKKLMQLTFRALADGLEEILKTKESPCKPSPSSTNRVA